MLGEGINSSLYKKPRVSVGTWTLRAIHVYILMLLRGIFKVWDAKAISGIWDHDVGNCLKPYSIHIDVCAISTYVHIHRRYMHGSTQFGGLFLVTSLLPPPCSVGRKRKPELQSSKSLDDHTNSKPALYQNPKPPLEEPSLPFEGALQAPLDPYVI